MPFATWWRGDPLPELPPLPTWSARRVEAWDDARRVTGLTEQRADLGARILAEINFMV